MSPRPSLVMKLTASGVANWAAIARSPSFSRSAASTTTTNLPSRTSSIASSMVANSLRFSTCISSDRIRVQEPLDIFRQDIRFQIDPVARREAAEWVARPQRRLQVHLASERLGARQRLAHDIERQLPVPFLGNGQADTVDGDRISDPGREAGLDDQPPVVERGHPP